MDGFRSGSMFCVVDFVRGRKRTVVPDSWLSINETLCLLPPNASESDLEALVRNHAEPGEGWQMLEVDSVETFRSYSEAKIQLKNSKEALQPESSISQRKRKKPSYLEDYSTRDSDDGRKPYTIFGMNFDEEAMSENEWIPLPEFNPRIEKVTSVKRKINKDNRPRSLFGQPQLSSEKENIDIMCDCQSSCHGTFLKALHKLLEQQQSMQKQQQSMQKQQQSMLKQLDRTNQLVQQLVEGQKQTYSQSRRVLEPQPVNQMDSQEEMDTLSQSRRILEPQPVNQMDAQEEMDALSQSKRVLEPHPVNQMDIQEEMDAFSQDGTSFAQSKQSTFAAPKSTENQIKFSEADDAYITGDKPTTAEGIEMEFNKSLRKQIKLALKELQTEDIERVLTTLETIGVENKDDLEYVKPSDLLEVLNEVQARKLVDSFQTHSESGVQNVSKSEASFPLFRQETKLADAEQSCIVDISWKRMSPELVALLKSNKELKPNKYKEMVRVIADDIVSWNIKASRSFIKSVAESWVKKYPILKDKFEGEVIGTGFDTLFNRLMCRVYNLRRRLNMTYNKGEDQDAKCKRKNTRSPLDFYGCDAWAPNLPDQGIQDNLERKKRRLLEMDVSKDYVEISTLMQDTYILQRKEINGGTDVKTLMFEWPFLFKMPGMLDHFKMLTGLDIRQKMNLILNEKFKNMVTFFQTSNKEKVKKFITSNNTTNNKLLLLLITVALYVDEDPSECIRTSEVLNPHDEREHIPCHPCLIGRGTSALKANEFMICVDKVVVNSEIKDGDTAVMMLFATYYVLNLAYPHSILLTLEFFQRCLIGINPLTGSKAETPHNETLTIHPRLLALVNKLRNFEEGLSIFIRT